MSTAAADNTIPLLSIQNAAAYVCMAHTVQ